MTPSRTFVACLAILACCTLACLAIPNLVGKLGSRLDPTHAAIMRLEGISNLYAVDHDGFPVGTTTEVREALLFGNDGRRTDPNFDEWPMDEWGTPIFYEYPSDKRKSDCPAIWSAGPDRRNGTSDDITNWDDLEL